MMSGSSSSRWTYEVFLSFRGTDTRKNFVDHVYAALAQAGIRAFRDDGDLPKGEEIFQQLLMAIQQSRISIVVFSKGYASSRFCLDELLEIVECKHRNTGQIIIPIFYHIDPSDVQKQRGSFAKAFARHEAAFKEEMGTVNKWRVALEEVASLRGFVLRDGLEAEFVHKIINAVMAELSNKRRYDVFLSFRGADTRMNFVDHLYTALVHAGIDTFRDDELLRGEEISQQLHKAIEQTRISLVVFSRGYASSSWCLDELVEILDRKHGNTGQIVVPVFYDIDPSVVQKQTGSFKEAFSRHEERFEQEKVKQWRVALMEIGNLSGWSLHGMPNQSESKFIAEIVKDVKRKLDRKLLDVPACLVGIETRVNHVLDLLTIGTSDVRIVGIHGIAGIGKTTIAKALFNKLHHEFEGSCFLVNIKEMTERPNGSVQLQEQFLSDILGWNYIGEIDYADRGIYLIKRQIGHKRVLLVLDDVDQQKQVYTLMGERTWFGPGSRIIITTRYKSVLDQLHVDEKYQVEVLNQVESLQLFSWYAFRQSHPPKHFVELSEDVLASAGGCPLTLEVLGSHFLGQSIHEWESAIENLPKNPIQKGLENPDKFWLQKGALDAVARQKKEAGQIDMGKRLMLMGGMGLATTPKTEEWESSAEIRLMDNELSDLPLLFLKEPENPDKIWLQKGALDAVAHQKKDASQIDIGKRLMLMGGMGLTTTPKTEEWESSVEIHLMDNELSDLPKNPSCPMLQALFLQGNSNLRKIPPFLFDHMPALQVLNLSGTGIKSLPESLFRLKNLKKLLLKHCHFLMTLSPSVGKLEDLEILDLEGTEIMELPKEVKKLTKLTSLEVAFLEPMDHRISEQSNALIPHGISSALSQLENLNIDVSPDDERWVECAEEIVSEVSRLKALNKLKLYLPRVELLILFKCFSKPIMLPSLLHFRLTVGHHAQRIMSRLPQDVEFELERYDRCLKYVNGKDVPEDIKMVLRHATAFFLDRHANVKRLSDFGLGNMKEVRCCVLGECNELQGIVDGDEIIGSDDVLQSLEYLYIYYMKNLSTIWTGPLLSCTLNCLKFLTLRKCPKLTTIFTPVLLVNLIHLEQLAVDDCPKIKSLVSCHDSEHEDFHFVLPNLKRISLHFLPRLTSISGGGLPRLEWMSFRYCPNLKNLPISKEFNGNLQKIKGERSWWAALVWESNQQHCWDNIFEPVDISDRI